jgi:hypothetical protein
MRSDTPDMTTPASYSKEKECDPAAENQKRLASCLEKARPSSLDTCFWWRAIVVCRNFLCAKQRLVDLWRLTHRHDNVLQLTSTPFRDTAAKQCGRYPGVMTQINW